MKLILVTAFLAAFSNVMAVERGLERTLVLNNVGLAYDVHNFALVKARLDVRIVQDGLEFRCGGLVPTASRAPTFPQFVSRITFFLLLDLDLNCSRACLIFFDS